MALQTEDEYPYYRSKFGLLFFDPDLINEYVDLWSNYLIRIDRVRSLYRFISTIDASNPLNFELKITLRISMLPRLRNQLPATASAMMRPTLSATVIILLKEVLCGPKVKMKIVWRSV